METPVKERPSKESSNGAPPRRRRSRISTLAGWWTVLVVAVATVLGGAPLYQGFRQSLADEHVNKLRMQVRLAAANWEREHTAAVANTRALTVVPPLTAIDTLRTQGRDTFEGADEALWRRRLETIYSGVLDANTDYVQARYVRVEGDGREVARVHRLQSDGPVQVVPREGLQSKRAEPYFAPSLALEAGHVLTSAISWNREHGKISEPRMLMVRYTAPVVSEDGTRRGFVALNVNLAAQLRRHLLTNLQDENSFGFVSDEQGRWVLPPISRTGEGLLPTAPLETRGVAELLGVAPTRGPADTDSAYIVDGTPSDLPMGRHHVAMQEVELDGGHVLRLGVLSPYSDSQVAVQTAMKGTVLTSLLGLVAMALVSWLGMARLLRPLDTVIAQLAAFSISDDPGAGAQAQSQQRVPPGPSTGPQSFNEAEQLAAEFVRMAERVSAQQRELQLEIAHRKRAEHLLSSALQEAETANSQLKAFSYSLAHDLRAPIRGVRFFAQALDEDSGERLDLVGREHLKRIALSAERMSRLVEAIMRLAKLRQRALHPEEVPLSLMAGRLAEELQATAEPPVSFTIEPDLHTVGDKAMLESLLHNLLSNAVKYSSRSAHPQVAFGSTKTSTGKAFFVRDNGIGFDKQHAEKVFHLFERLHHDGEYEGLGVGLALAHGIVERHAGRIWAEAFPGSGATFYFVLPNHAA